MNVIKDWMVPLRSFTASRSDSGVGDPAVIPDRDIWRTANSMIERHSEDATIQAAMRADELLEAGDLEGAKVWRRIVAAIVSLQRKEPDEGEPVH